MLTRCTCILLALTLLQISSVEPAGKYDPRGAYISLHAKWNSTPLLHEAAEFLADEHPSLLWSFVDAWHARSEVDPRDCWTDLVSTAAQLITPQLSKVMQLVVGLRQYSPRLELFHQVALQSAGTQGGCCWADVHGDIAPDVPALRSLLAKHTAQPHTPLPLPSFDHVYPGTPVGAVNTQDAVVVVLYGALGSACFQLLHQEMVDQVTALEGNTGGPRVVYLWRPHAPPQCMDDPAAVSRCGLHGAHERLDLPSFGAEFVIKNMEYKTMDEKAPAGEVPSPAADGPDELRGFRFDVLLKRKPEAAEALMAFREHLLESALEDDTLKVWDVQELGMKAAQRILSASDPLFMLTELSQNFPSRTRSVSQSTLDAAVLEELEANQQLLPGGRNLMILNGVMMDLDSTDLYQLLSRVRSEVRLADALAGTGMGAEEVGALMMLRSAAPAAREEDAAVVLNEAEDIFWLNDIETDDVYAAWGRDLAGIFMRLMPGQFHRIARNLYNGVLVTDPGTTDGLMALATASQVVTGRYPIRMGVVLQCRAVLKAPLQDRTTVAWPDLSLCERVARTWYALAHGAAPQAAGSMATTLLALADDEDALEVSDSELSEAFKDQWAKFTRSSPEEASQAWDALVGATDEDGAAGRVQRAAQYVAEKGVVAESSTAFYFNGRLQRRHGDWQTSLIVPALYEMQFLQEAIYMQKIKGDTDDVYAEILEVKGALPRANTAVFSDASDRVRMVRLAGSVLNPQRNPTLSALAYLHAPGSQDTPAPTTIWLVADLSSPAAASTLHAAVSFLVNGPGSAACRLALVVNPADAASPPPLLTRIVLAAAHAPSRRAKVPPFLLALLTDVQRSIEVPLAGASESLLDDDVTLLAAALSHAEAAGLQTTWLREALEALDSGVAAPAHVRALAMDHAAIVRALGLRAGALAVVTNGRVVTAHQPGEVSPLSLAAGDIHLMAVKASTAMYSDAVGSVLEEAVDEGRALAQGDEPMSVAQLSDCAMVASNMLTMDDAVVDDLNVRLMRALPNFAVEHSSVTLDHQGGLPLQFMLFLDPLCRAAQRISSLLRFMRDALGVSVKLVMNPVRELTGMPLKTFYRYSLPDVELRGDILHFLTPPVAHFNSLPPTKVLTLHMDVPESWLVQATAAEVDLDNFKPQDLGSEPNLYAEFELEALLVTGSCTDVAPVRREDVHPRGVQLALGPPGGDPLVDTLVMSNLGYFQLKAAPGLWSLQLAPGRSRALYQVVGSSGMGEGDPDPSHQPGGSDGHVPVVVSSFDGRSMQLKLRKREGMEVEDVLGGDGEGKHDGLLDKVSSWLRPGDQVAEGKEPLNIFTIASGHMYERLQKIMILSVIKNTKMRVKVWFIKNYMSPQMKAFVPRMAARYDFDYEFVTYKWPEWLHKQTDKQRIIWAYKILFLDVLFPLNVTKVVFTDSDQIIRGDMADLWNMDLQGAPYGYTPFCDNNKEMDGFRFWKQGFWRDHLRGKPYHISALYVVDLQRFRQMAAGDQLRVIYDGLSRDPNSLANLDQDLPNYAQHQVPIFSLPQEWLWCETWCGNATKAAAKTIDLCNNPLTKEPKLQGARRIVAEWESLDQEAQACTLQLGEVDGGAAQEGEAPDADLNTYDVKDEL